MLVSNLEDNEVEISLSEEEDEKTSLKTYRCVIKEKLGK